MLLVNGATKRSPLRPRFAGIMSILHGNDSSVAIASLLPSKRSGWEWTRHFFSWDGDGLDVDDIMEILIKLGNNDSFIILMLY